jgi:UDP-N-acetylglucosamine:LPS N-acetylglucosamine transferase
LPENVRFIGILSRLSGHFPEDNFHTGKCTVILSGPEPQRSILKQKITKILLSQRKPAVILEGKPGKAYESYSLNNIVYYNHLSLNETIKLLKESESIITRPGYTSIMELISLGRSALLIPTPGQTEQEYLAESLSNKGWFRSVAQTDLDEDTAIQSISPVLVTGITEESVSLLEVALRELLE